jgi:uncharacterized protein YecE (DUF72 family)
MTGTARVGCSGWSYRAWRGPAYPREAPARTWFDHYATRFSTVELNATFYRLPSEHAVEQWRDQAPPTFTYAAKVGAFGTHRKKLRDPETWLPRHLERTDLLGDHLGPNLLQLPPRWRRDVGRLEAFLDVAPVRQRWAVELRDPSWLHDDVLQVLAAHGAALCIHDLLPDHPWERTAEWTYLRFHGPRALQDPYVDRYPRRRLATIADRLAAWLAAGTDVYAYFNNDQGAASWHDAALLDAALGSDPG